MKTFVSLSIDYDHPHETSAIVFQAKNEEEAVIAIAEDIIGKDEIEDFRENAEPGDSFVDFVFTAMLEDYPVMVKEVKVSPSYEEAKNEEFNCYYESDVLELLKKKYPTKK